MPSFVNAVLIVLSAVGAQNHLCETIEWQHSADSAANDEL